MKNQKMFYVMIALILLIIGGFIGSSITNNLRFDPFKSTASPWEGSITAMSTSGKINHGNIFVNIYNDYNSPIYVVDIVNEAGEAAKIAAIANRINSYKRNGLVFKSVHDWSVFRADSEGQFLTQIAIPTEGQIDVFFNSKDSSELTIRYFLRVGDDEVRLVTDMFKLGDDGFYNKK